MSARSDTRGLLDTSLIAKAVRGAKGRNVRAAATSTIIDNDEERIEDESNPLITTNKSKAKSSVTPTSKPLSKAEQRKLAKLAEAKERKSRMTAIYQGLAKTRLTTDQHKLLASSGELGQRETHRQRVARAVRESQAGISAVDTNEIKREVARLHHGHDVDDTTMKQLLLRRTRTHSSRSVSASHREYVDSFGLDPTRWRSTANAEGSIKFDTNRTISYGSDDDDENDSQNASDNEAEEQASETEENEHNDSDDDEDGDESMMTGDDLHTTATNAASALSSSAKDSTGLYSISFDVIAASNRPKKRRIALVLPGQQLAPVSAVAVDNNSSEMNDTESNDDAVTATKTPAKPSAAERAVSEIVALQVKRGKGTIEPAKPDPVAQLLASHGATTNASKFQRTSRAVLTRQPLPAGAEYYHAEETVVRVSNNDQFYGERAAPADINELATRKKGESIIETHRGSSVSHDRPLLYTRQLTGGRYVTYVNRLPVIHQSRLSLPITSHEQEIVESLSQHDVIIVQGETGSGKTTQVPQFLLENGFTFGDRQGMIGVTQPRRVAAIATCQRVSEELNLPTIDNNNKKQIPTFNQRDIEKLLESERQSRLARGENVERGALTVFNPYNTVSYQVRYDSQVTSTTRIKFMTDGVLLREIMLDFLLTKYSVIIIDEAHERGRNTDVLIGLLTRSIRMRKKLFLEFKDSVRSNGDVDGGASVDGSGKPVIRSPLKLIIMSATLNTDDFLASNTGLFDDPPKILTIPVRQHPVSVHFNRVTPINDYLEAMLVKVMRMHVKLPDGGILVFVTGRDEIEYLCSAMTKLWNEREKRKVNLLQDQEAADSVRTSASNTGGGDGRSEDEKQFDLDDELASSAENGDADTAMTSTATVADSSTTTGDSIDSEMNAVFASDRKGQSLVPYCLPLYSLLPAHLQMRVFQPPPAGHRLIVFATNIAETSLTIPSITYVLDSGREKRKVWDRISGCSHYTVDWISQASAEQRKGRAGRTGPGHVYRLYSSAVYGNHFPLHNPPEILREPIESLVLQMKSMGIANIERFPFPTMPDMRQLQLAEDMLVMLGALAKKSKAITELGSTLALFPIMPRYSKMLVLAHQGQCLPYIIAIVAAVSVEQLMLHIKMKDSKIESDSDSDSDNDIVGSEKAKEREKKRAKRKQLYDALFQARQRWHHNDSDLLTYLRMIGGYEFALTNSNKDTKKQKAKEFCDKNFLRLKAMEEIEQLRNQLNSILIASITKTTIPTSDSAEAPGSGDAELAEEEAKKADKLNSNSAVVKQLLAPMKPPSPTQERLIRQLIAAGLIDRVARKLTEEEKRLGLEKNLASFENASKQDLANVYEILSNNELVYVHPSSVLYPATSQPRYCVYHALTVNQRGKHYMRDVTMIDEDTLIDIGDAAGLVNWGAFLDDPRPVYNADRDCVEGWKKATFGPKRWELKPQRKSLNGSPTDELKHFARLLLEGDVFVGLKPLLPFFVAKPHHITQKGTTLRKDLLAIVQRLQRDGVVSRKQLLQQWKRDSNYLLAECEAWLQPIAKSRLTSAWPPSSASKRRNV